MLWSLLLLSSVVLVVVADNRPVVGIVTQPREQGWPDLGRDYIAASYVKFVEAAGARVLVIRYDGDNAYLEAQSKMVDAVLFPGGGQNFDTTPGLVGTASFFVNKALTEQLPVFGHCQGFELLLVVASGLPRSQCMTRDLPSQNQSLPLAILPGARATSQWFASMTDAVALVLENVAATFNNHEWSVTPAMFEKLPGVTGNYRALSTSTADGSKAPFVSTFEHVKAPIFAMQFHAEKTIFEWDPHEQICHARDCLTAVNYFVSFMASRVRQVMRTRAPIDETASIYAFNASRSSSFSSFNQVYFFDPIESVFK